MKRKKYGNWLILFYFIGTILISSCCEKTSETLKEHNNGESQDTSIFIKTNPEEDTSIFIKTNPEVDGFVPNKETAIKVAEAIWLPIYGKEIYEYKPYIAVLTEDQIWKVTGTVHSFVGGAPYAFINKLDGKIIKIYHEE